MPTITDASGERVGGLNSSSPGLGALRTEVVKAAKVHRHTLSSAPSYALLQPEIRREPPQPSLTALGAVTPPVEIVRLMLRTVV